MGSSTSRSFSPNKLCGTNVMKVGKHRKSSSSEMCDEIIEKVVCNESDLKENEMKVFDIDEGKVLLVKQRGEINAIGTKCSHYGAPLVTGALSDGRVRCPWHGACFNLKTGDIEDFPGVDSIPCYQVKIIEDGQVQVIAKKSDLTDNIRKKKMFKRNKCDNATFVVVGGGPSGATCVETLRSEGYVGRLIMICKEKYLPYDRIKLSKAGMQTDIEKLQFRNKAFYDDCNIEVMLGKEVQKVDTKANKITLDCGEHIDYTALYLATGCKPRTLDVPGSDLKNLFTIRELDDAINIVQALGENKDKDMVVLGLSFIGLECAASCVDKAKSVTVVGTGKEPLASVFGDEIGKGLRQLFESNNVKFEFETTVVKLKGETQVQSVELKNGKELPADVFVMGIGTVYNTEFLQGSNIVMEPNGSVHVNDRLQTNIDNVFAGGDIAFAPVYSQNNEKASIGHIGLSQYHGRIAALNMLKKDVQLKAVPFFWTMVFGKPIRYAGYGKYSSILIDGDVNEFKFVIFFFDESDRVVAIAESQRGPIVAQYAEYLSQGKVLHKKDLENDRFAWVKEITPNNE